MVRSDKDNAAVGPTLLVSALLLLGSGLYAAFVLEEDTGEAIEAQETDEGPSDWFVINLVYKRSVYVPYATGLSGYGCTTSTVNSEMPLEGCGFRANETAEKITAEIRFSDPTVDARVGLRHHATDTFHTVSEEGTLNITDEDVDGDLSGVWKLVAEPYGVEDSFGVAANVAVTTGYPSVEVPAWTAGYHDAATETSWCASGCTFHIPQDAQDPRARLTHSDETSLTFTVEHAKTGETIPIEEKELVALTPGEWTLIPEVEDQERSLLNDAAKIMGNDRWSLHARWSR